MTPRREPPPGPHRLLLYGLPGAEIRAVCTCAWGRTFSGGHTVEDYARLETMHAPAVEATPEGAAP